MDAQGNDGAWVPRCVRTLVCRRTITTARPPCTSQSQYTSHWDFRYSPAGLQRCSSASRRLALFSLSPAAKQVEMSVCLMSELLIKSHLVSRLYRCTVVKWTSYAAIISTRLGGRFVLFQAGYLVLPVAVACNVICMKSVERSADIDANR